MEHVDVLIIGAGISGIGMGCQLSERCTDRTFAILERRENIGGTWDLFRYPGIRSDSDMYTFGYRFRPWTEPKDIADGPSILKYLNETIDAYGIRDRIRFSHKVSRVNWSSSDKRWVADVTNTVTGDVFQISAGFLMACTGYYDYDQGYLPDFEGYEDFKGTIVHPQHWPDDLDYIGRDVVVIGSGATAVTLIPNMAGDTSHITMLQRSPTYMTTRPAVDSVAEKIKKWLPTRLAYKLVRLKNMLLGWYVYRLSRRKPEKMKAFFINQVKGAVGPDIDVEKHFTPSYDPWDQRLCLVPDSDLFHCLREGSASVVTDHIDRFTEEGILLKSGKELKTDIIITATGLNLQFFGGIGLCVDDQPVDASTLVTYRGMMFGNIPNFAVVFGYTNASWTLKADLTFEYVCRLLNLMRKKGYASVTPVHSEEGAVPEPFLGLRSGYILRSAGDLPKQGAASPWRNKDNYLADRRSIRHADLEDGILSYE